MISRTSGSVITALETATHPELSVTVTEYEPGDKPIAVDPF